MKKLLAAAAVVGLVGFTTSCNKVCECTTYLLDEKVSVMEYEIKSSEDCAKFITYDEITKSGIKCDKK